MKKILLILLLSRIAICESQILVTTPVIAPYVYVAPSTYTVYTIPVTGYVVPNYVPSYINFGNNFIVPTTVVNPQPYIPPTYFRPILPPTGCQPISLQINIKVK